MDNTSVEVELTVSQAARLANKHRRTILNWIKQGYLPATRLPGKKGHYRVRLENLKKILNNRYHPED